MEGLRVMIYSVAEGMTQDGKKKGEKIMGEQIPLSYKLLEKELDEQQNQKLQRKDIPIITRDEFLTIAQNLKDPLQMEDIEPATSFLHNIGMFIRLILEIPMNAKNICSISRCMIIRTEILCI